LARVKFDWSQLPFRRFSHTPDHPFVADLDILGQHSLHQLLDSATSIGGSNRLRDWLIEPNPDSDRITLRQQLVKELAPLRLYRDKLNLESAIIQKPHSEIDEGEWIATWIEQNQASPPLNVSLIISSGLLLFSYVLLILTFLVDFQQYWIFTFTIYIAIFVFSQLKLAPLFSEARTLEISLQKFRAVFRHIERFSYSHTPNLRKLCEPFMQSDDQPSSHIRRLAFIMTGASLRTNSLLWIFANILMPWDLWFGHRFTREKKTLSHHLPEWLDIWFELEGLSSLANYAALNPACVYPTIEPASETGMLFAAQELGHPLIPDTERVCNEFAIERSNAINIITGSNMSGKSTFLRTIGINHVLTYAGGPVCASSFQTRWLRLFSCIQVADSIADGFSYFYAEVRRLRILLDELKRSSERPLLFLIDEIFRGTNNRERLIGSRSYIRELAKNTGIGLISTHDLELVHLDEEIDSIKNFHFREDIIDGAMSFDYVLHDGPCPTTNALKIMELEGLPIEIEPDA